MLSDGHYVEPYSGGASVALSVLFNEYSSEIHINDFDYNVYCFWKSVLNHTEELCELIKKTPVDMDAWYIQKSIQANPRKYKQLQVGFSTFFLNRTNRSGILKAGVIGGKNQEGEWKIDARFNKEDLILRIRKIAAQKGRIHLYNLDAIDLIKRLKKDLPKKSFFYFDPPYYKKGKELYINFYNHSDHVAVSQMVASLKDKYWIVSYDNDINIQEFYSNYRQQVYDLHYHANAATAGTEILVFSDKMLVPAITNPLDKKQIRHFSQHGFYLKQGSWKSGNVGTV
jgi:DNA adenine methylase